MKICIPNLNKNGVGGGWTFLRNFLKATALDVQIVDKIEDCDILFICGPTMVAREDVQKAERLGKGIVFRVDNIPEDYRNRGTAISRLKDFSKMADAVVYQSMWAREYVMGLTGVDGTVIYNGVDRLLFNLEHRTKNIKNVLYVRSSTNENKRWQEAKYYFRQMWLQDKELNFVVVGNFSDYIKLYGEEIVTNYRLGMFDEPMDFIGQVNSQEKMAVIYSDCHTLLAPYYNDACSNTILEARASGCKIDTCLSGATGGTPEIMALPDEFIGIDRMGKEYMSLFNLVLQ